MGCQELQVNDYFRVTGSASGTDVPYYALADANKNITEYFDTNGTVQAHYEYSPFGKITKKPGTMQNDFDYRFSSEAFDTETGLSYYNYRYYSPELGRWLSRDPIEERGGVNLYAMTSNDLVNKYDINGLSSATLTASHQGTGHASVEAKPSWWEAYIWEQGPGANWDKMRRYASVYSKFTSTSTSASVFQFGHTEMPYSSYHLQMSSGVNIYLSVTNDSCKCCKINISSNTNAVDSGTPTGGYRTLAQYTGPDSICVKIGETKKIGQLIVGFGWDHYNTDGSTFVSASASASVSVSCAE